MASSMTSDRLLIVGSGWVAVLSDGLLIVGSGWVAAFTEYKGTDCAGVEK